LESDLLFFFSLCFQCLLLCSYRPFNSSFFISHFPSFLFESPSSSLYNQKSAYIKPLDQAWPSKPNKRLQQALAACREEQNMVDFVVSGVVAEIKSSVFRTLKGEGWLGCRVRATPQLIANNNNIYNGTSGGAGSAGTSHVNKKDFGTRKRDQPGALGGEVVGNTRKGPPIKCIGIITQYMRGLGKHLVIFQSPLLQPKVKAAISFFFHVSIPIPLLYYIILFDLIPTSSDSVFGPSIPFYCVSSVRTPSTPQLSL
jgi:hypothetical protein